MTDVVQQIEGRLVSLAESWPLQLSVQPASDPLWSVTLDEHAVVEIRGQPSQVGALRPGMWVSVKGHSLGPYALRGDHIQVA